MLQARSRVTLVLLLALAAPLSHAGTGVGAAQVEDLYFGGREQDALPLLEALLEQRPDDALTAYRIYQCATELQLEQSELAQRRERALATLERAAAGLDPVPVYYLALLLEDTEPERIEPLARRTLDAHPPDGAAQLDPFSISRLAGLAYFRLDQIDLAARYIDRYLKAGDGAWTADLAARQTIEIMDEVGPPTGKIDGWTKIVRKAVRRRPDDVRLGIAYAGLLFDLGEQRKARSEVQRLLKSRVERPLDQWRLAGYAMQIERPEAAVPLLRRATEAAPHNAELWFYLGNALRQTGELEASIAASRRALLVDPGFGNAWGSIGLTLKQAGRGEEALDAFRRAREAGVNASLYLTAEASLLVSMGRSREAVELFSDVVGELAKPGDDVAPLDYDAIDPQQALAAFDPSDPLYDDVDAVYVLDASQVEWTLAGMTETYHGMLHLLTERAVEGLGELRLNYDAENSALNVHVARTWKPDGTVVEADIERAHELAPAETQESRVYSGQRVRVISMPALETGATIEWKFTRARTLLFEATWWADWSFESGLPAVTSRFTVATRKDTPDVTVVTRNHDALPEVSERDGMLVRRWVLEKRPGLPDEPAAPRFQDRVASVHVSSLASWDELGAWYRELSGGAAELTDEIRAATREAIGETAAAAPRTPERIREIAHRLYSLVSGRIRYVGIEFGVGGYQPRNVADTWATGFGDCKDQATLLIGMLAEAGIEAHPALVRTESRTDLATWPPSPSVFDHLIVYIPGAGDDGAGLFVDPTLPLLGPGDLPASDQGAPALIVRPDAVELAGVPRTPAGSNVFEVERVVDLRDPARTAVHDESITRGYFANLLRLTYGRASKEELLEFSAMGFRDDFPNATEITVSSLTGQDPGEPEARLVETCVVPDVLRPLAGGRHLLELGESDVIESLLGRSPGAERSTDYLPPVAFRYRFVTRALLPSGWTLDAGPEPVELELPEGRYRKRLELQDDALVVTTEFETPGDRVPAARYPEFERLLALAARQRVWSVVLSEAGEN